MHVLTEFEKGHLATMPPERIIRDQTLIGSGVTYENGGVNPSEAYRYGFKIKGGNGAIIDCLVKDHKTAALFKGTPGINLCIGLTVQGRASFFVKSKNKYDPTGSGLLYEGASGIKYVRGLVMDGGILNPKSSYSGLDGNKDIMAGGTSTSSTKDVDRLHGYNLRVRNAKELFDNKNSGNIQKMVAENGYRMERSWGVHLGRVDCHYYLGEGRQFIWMKDGDGSFSAFGCTWSLGTENSPGTTWDRLADIPGEYLGMDGGSDGRNLIDLPAPPSWVMDPFWLQARELGDIVQPPVEPPVEPPTGPPVDPTDPPDTTDEQLAKISEDLDRVEAEVNRIGVHFT